MRLNVDVNSEEYEAFRWWCAERGLTMSAVIRELIVGYIGAEFFKRFGVIAPKGEDDES